MATPSDSAASHFLFGAWCQRGSELIYLCVVEQWIELYCIWIWNFNFVCVRLCELEKFGCVLVMIYSAFYLLRTVYARLKNCMKSVFFCCAEDRRVRRFSWSFRIFRTFRTWPETPDPSALELFFFLVECIICHEHLTFICRTSQAPHCCNTLLFLLLCKILALMGPLIFKIKMHILRGSITKALNIHCLFLIWLKCVVINHQKGGDWRVSWPLSGFWWFNDTHLSS
jgi:hypothetical protein